MAATSTRTFRPSAGQRRLGAKLIGAALSLAFVLVFNFFLFRVLPGNPAKNLTRNRLVPAEQVEVLRESFGLGKPLPPAVRPVRARHPERGHRHLLQVPPAGVGGDRGADLADGAAARPLHAPVDGDRGCGSASGGRGGATACSTGCRWGRRWPCTPCPSSGSA